MADVLQQVRDLHFGDRPRAESLLASLIRATFNLDVERVELRPSPVSLNSFSGIVFLSSGDPLFVKAHTETDTIIQEYYNVSLLQSAGYPVIKPVFQSGDPGRQMLLYPWIREPSMFDAARTVEDTGAFALAEQVRRTQTAADMQLLPIFEQSFKYTTAPEAATAPIHQLFFHRLVGGRLERFYQWDIERRTTDVTFGSGGNVIHLQDLMIRPWVINGVPYEATIADLIDAAILVLNPGRDQATIIGHGDAHNGNVFLGEHGVTYFDPAFAGKHHPLLDQAKPLFHNVFASWMYYPERVARDLDLSFEIRSGTVVVEHAFSLSDIRHFFLKSKITHTIIPTLSWLQSMGLLDENWRNYIKLALFCCPFLTINLLALPPEITVLGLSMAIEMGAESGGAHSFIDQSLDEAETGLSSSSPARVT
jgi:hypothetical protein